MDLRQLTMTTFVLLQATWPVEKSSHLIERLKPSHVIVHHRNSQDVYYLFSAQEVLGLLTSSLHTSSVYEALHLSERSVTPAFESDTDVERIPDQCIVLEDSDLVGFFDVSFLPELTVRRAGKGHRPLIKPEPELRTLVAEFPERVRLHERFSLLISLSASSSSETGVTMPLALPLGAAVDILIQPKHGLVLEGSGEATLTVSSKRKLPLQFKLRGVTPGPAQLQVLAFHKGQPLGKLLLRLTVLEAQVNSAMEYRSREQFLAPVNLHQPDLQLLILGYPGDEGPEFTFYLTAQNPALELNLKAFGPIRLKVNALHYFQDFFQDIEQLPLNDSREKTIAAQRLAAKGTTLFRSLFPADLQQLIWSLRNRIQSIEVQSVEPWIPWELCKLYGHKWGRVVEGPFLCEAFAITRWIPGIAKKPSLELKKIAVVVPSDSQLACALDERAYLLSLASSTRQVKCVPPTFLDLREALASGQYDSWHFSGHGSFRGLDPNKSMILLENQETFTPEDLSGVVTNLGVTNPLVFLNACQVGRSAMSLTDIGGWASQFLKAGAGTFIGPYWSIYDTPAFDFATALYSRLLSGMPIGKAVQQARVAIKSAGDPTWLAYTVFADPLATVREGIPSPQ